MDMKGQAELRNLLKSAGDDAPKVLGQALSEEAQIMMRDSQKLVPHADGTLMSSGVVEPPQINGKSVVVRLGYGGAASKYAERQHDDLNLNHPDPRNSKSRASGQPKYLEEPVRARMDDLQKNLLERVRRIVAKR